MHRAERKLWKWLVGQTRSVEATRRQKKGEASCSPCSIYCRIVQELFLHQKVQACVSAAKIKTEDSLIGCNSLCSVPREPSGITDSLRKMLLITL